MNDAATHVVLGAGGSISSVLVPVLVERGHRVKLVSRSGRTMPGAEAASADLLDARAVTDQVPDGATVFLLAGLRYAAAVWEDEWPRR